MGYSMDMSGEIEKTLIPEGWYEFTIVEMTEETSKKGNAMFKVVCELVDGGGAIDVYCVAEKGKRWKLKQLLKACGILPDADANFNWDIPDIKDSKIHGRVAHESDDWIDRDGKTRTSVKSVIAEFRSIGDMLT